MGTLNQTVLFPGAYSDNNPGIHNSNVYMPKAAYIFPGPPMLHLASPADMTGKVLVDSLSSRSGNLSPSPSQGLHRQSSAGGYCIILWIILAFVDNIGWLCMRCPGNKIIMWPPYACVKHWNKQLYTGDLYTHSCFNKCHMSQWVHVTTQIPRAYWTAMTHTMTDTVR
jgi:hypothetical protein